MKYQILKTGWMGRAVRNVTMVFMFTSQLIVASLLPASLIEHFKLCLGASWGTLWVLICTFYLCYWQFVFWPFKCSLNHDATCKILLARIPPPTHTTPIHLIKSQLLFTTAERRTTALSFFYAFYIYFSLYCMWERVLLYVNVILYCIVFWFSWLKTNHGSSN